MSLDDALAPELDALKARERFRVPQSFAGPDRAHPQSPADETLISFCSNDYLGLATHPAVRQAAADSASRDGVGAGASRLVSGETPAHRALERNLASFLKIEDALLFPSGYQANIGVVTALAGPADFIASDAANHASLIDGCRLSRAQVAIYEHGNIDSAAAALARGKRARRRFLITESLFSMDGDQAPLSRLDELCAYHDAHLIVDEAHALGCLGPSGRGICAALNVQPAVLIGTLGKALGTSGGFVASSAAVRDTLVNRARTYIYTTAAPGPIVAATAAALEIVRGPEGDRLRLALAENVSRIRRAIPIPPPSHGDPSSNHILPLIVGADSSALHLAAQLRALGMLIPAIRPPTVPEGTARLRLTVSAAHTKTDLDCLIHTLTDLAFLLAEAGATGSEQTPTAPNRPVT